MSMVSRPFLAKLSNIISRAHTGADDNSSVLPFGGLNIILVGDFHQFLLVATKASAPLFWPCNMERDTEDELLGRHIYEQFDVVVRLKTQVRVTDPRWLDLLQHIRNGSCSKHHINMLWGLVLDNATCPPTDFHSSPWKDVVLVTPRHAVHMQWNSMTAYEQANMENILLISCPAQDSVGGRALTLPEKFAVAANPKSGRGCNRQQWGGLLDKVVLAIGMHVMVTFNVTTDLDITNGAQGCVINIVLDSRESLKRSANNVIQLEYPPVYVLMEMNRMKVNALPGLPTGVLPVTPICRTFSVSSAGGKWTTISHVQLPITAAYAFTDYHTQAQTLEHCIIDIGMPPSGQLTPFNAYIALSRSWGRDTTQLLRDFDVRLFTQHPSEYLRNEDKCLDKMDESTKLWWQMTKGSGGVYK
ncbi:hypothetical protein M404DRAFT_18813 [Pisolithus tinctorius Marx 270]|uniref:DNA helicase n=1 Tax=Pisolithus tinctorius Marx 270 TaxID=870435 RepID=A0A0C3PWP4_PISTI|nr:hypothetical protein M404DRAFT_18813 [Pisolithus tinctorius Marx 270]